MEQWVLWGLALYGAIWFLLTHIIRRFSLEFPENCVHLVLLTKNSQGSIEWVIRSFFLLNWCRGRESLVTCIDEESADDTKVIIQQLQQIYPRLKLVSAYDPVAEILAGETVKQEGVQVIVMDLKRKRWPLGVSAIGK